MKRPVFTIGYERGGQTQIISALGAAGVDIVLDVRELPNSRRAGFSKRSLAASLGAAGIDYRHLKALGTPKAGRLANRARRWDEFWSIVDEALDRPEARLALEEAAELAAAKRVCLLCLEHDWRICHRARLAEELARRGFDIHHLEPAEPSGL
jgi:uncharacterized protein (DUF488 family)